MRYYAASLVLLLAASVSPAVDDRAARLADGAVVTLAKGAVEFDAPAGWEAVKVTDLETTRGYRKAGSTISVKVLAPGQKVTAADQGPALAKAIAEQLNKSGAKVVLEPAVVEDGRFDLKVTEKHELKGQTVQATFLFKMVGNRSVSVSVQTLQTGDDARKAIAAGEKLLLEARVGGPDLRLPADARPALKLAGSPKRVALGKAGVQYSVSSSWEEKLTDRADGMLAEYRLDGSAMLVSARRLPPEAKDPEIRDLVVQEMVKAETHQLKLDDAGARGGEREVVDDARFLRKTRTTYDHRGQKLITDSRQVLVGDLLLSISTMSRGDDHPAVEESADALAASAQKN